jgi:hypothetical protein
MPYAEALLSFSLCPFPSQLNNVARFLESKGHVPEALSVATDPEYR